LTRSCWLRLICPTRLGKYSAFLRV